MIIRTAIGLFITLSTIAAAAQTSKPAAPYAGQQTRDIKAL